jgi:8-oxo-dGTP pyrophosphatase MutT (NUDIX family)
MIVGTETIFDVISMITPFDALEENQIQETLAWIESGEPIFRIQKPDIPNKHLVSYFLLFDEIALKVLLVDHKKSGLWLPAGGHVEIDEDPYQTVRRECLEELNIEANFWCEEPIFLTSTLTVGLTAGHTDISLWYVLKGNEKGQYLFDRREFNGVEWFGFDEIPYKKSDPHMGRFIKKLQSLL